MKAYQAFRSTFQHFPGVDQNGFAVACKLSCFIVTVSCALLSYAAPDSAFQTESVKVGRNGFALILPVKIFGEDAANFVFDTGSHTVVYDAQYRKLLEPLRDGNVVAGGKKLSVQLFRPASIDIGDLELLSTRPVACFDLRRFEKVFGREIAGIIGTSALGDLSIRIDFAQGKMTMARGHSPYSTDGYFATIFSVIGGVPFISVTVGGRQEEVMVDTGQSEGLRLRSTVFSELVEADQLSVQGDVEVVGVSGSRKVPPRKT